jgi:hypothetical protein
MEDAVAAEDRPGAEHGLATDLSTVTDDRTELGQTGFDSLAIFFAHRHKASVQSHVRADHSRSEVRFVSEDGITDIVIMRDLAPIEEQTVFELARIPEDAVIAYYDVFPEVGPAANDCPTTDPGGTLDDRVRLHARTRSEIDPISDDRSFVDLTLLGLGPDPVEFFSEVGFDAG